MSRLLDYLFSNNVDFTIGTYVTILTIFTTLIGGLVISICQHANRLNQVEMENKALKQENAKLVNDLDDLKRGSKRSD